MLLEKNFKICGLNVHIYDFENIGDILPLHIHDSRSAHITIVAKGSLKVLTHDDNNGQIISSGNLLDCNMGAWHGFEALEPNSRIINVTKIVNF